MAEKEDTAASDARKVLGLDAFKIAIANEQLVRENPRPGLEAAWLGEAKRLYQRFGRLLSAVSHRDPTHREHRMANGEDVEAAEAEAERELWAMTSALLTETERQGMASRELLLFLESIDRAAKARTPALPSRGSPFASPAHLMVFLVGLTVRESLRMRLRQEGRQVAALIERWADSAPDPRRTSKYELAADLWNDVGGRTGRGDSWTSSSVKKLWISRPQNP